LTATRSTAVRRDRALVENAERRFELRGARGKPDQRPFLRIGDEFALAVFKGQRHAIFRRHQSAQRSAQHHARRQDAGRAQEFPSIEFGLGVHRWKTW
jgi:hypothetical protein